MKWVDIVSLGKAARSRSKTLYPLRASSMAVGEPAQRAPTTMTSYTGSPLSLIYLPSGNLSVFPYAACLALTGRLAFFQYEDDFQIDLVAPDGSVLYQHVHVLDMSGLDIPEGAGGPVNGLVYCIFEALL